MNQTLQEGLWDLSQPGELYRLLFEESTDGIFITDPRGRYVAVNPRGTELTGFDREELLSMSISDLIPSEDLAREPIRTGDLRQGRIMTNERRIRRKDGRQLAVEIRTRMLPNGNILGIATDITDRKLAEAVADQNARELANARLGKAARQELAERERSEGELSRLNAILENTSDLVSAALPDARLTYLNRAGRRMAGWDQEESLDGKVIADLHPDWVMRKIESEGLPSAAALGSWEGETAIRHRDGREIPVSQVILSHRSADGDLQYFSTIMRNIAERKHAQKKLAHSHDLMRYIIEHNRSAVAVHDRGMRYIYVSQRYLDEYNVKELAYKVHHALLDQGC